MHLMWQGCAEQVGLAVLERGQCPVWGLNQRAVGSQEVGRWQRMGEEGSQRNSDPGVYGGFAEATEGFGTWVMTGNPCTLSPAQVPGREGAVGSEEQRVCEGRLSQRAPATHDAILLPLQSPQIMWTPHQIQVPLSLELLSTTHPLRTKTPHFGRIQAAPHLQPPAPSRGLESKCPTTHHPGGPWGVSPLDPCPPLVSTWECLGEGWGRVRQELLADPDPSPYRKPIFSDPPHPYGGRPGLPSSPKTLPSSQPPGFQAATITASLSPSQNLSSAQGAPSYLSR